MMETYRHEIKYVCTAAQIEDIKMRLSAVAAIDKNAHNGSYIIRSIYFDDYYNSSYYDNESGVDPREKWRIRIYNGDDSRILLECKRKESGKVNKKSDIISLNEFYDILQGKLDSYKFDSRKVFNRFKILTEIKLLRPVVIVQYKRFPFICDEGNVRITLDCDISSSCDFGNFFSDKLYLQPIQSKYRQLLEVKYDELLPDEIYNVTQLKNMLQQSFSKYYLCRKVGKL